jgi:sulfur transfer protein SufE
VLTYARLQGRNSLIEHFHNSKVLNQKEKRYRPIIKMGGLEEMLEMQRRGQSSGG